MEPIRQGWVDLVSVVLRHRPPPPMPAPVMVPPADAEEEQADAAPSASEFGYAEGQSFMIEYRDSAGGTSRRRITVWNIQPGAGGVPCLLARCHEREANRSFRADRITAIITADGEVLSDVRSFLAERLGVQVEADAGARAQRWPRVLAAVRPQAQILAGLSLADGAKHPDEIAVMTGFCARVAAAAGLGLDREEEVALARYLANLRPDRVTMLKAVDRMLDAGPAAQAALLNAGAAVIAADGIEHIEELRFIRALRQDLIGVQ